MSQCTFRQARLHGWASVVAVLGFLHILAITTLLLFRDSDVANVSAPLRLQFSDDPDLDGVLSAIEASDIPRFRRFLARMRADVNARDNDGQTALTRAARARSPEMCHMLLQRGANQDACDGWGQTPLLYAVVAPDQTANSLVELLLRYGADPNRCNCYGSGPLAETARCGRADLARRLIRAGAALDLPSVNGWTPLHWAVVSDHAEVVAVLLQSGADPTVIDIAGETPLQLAEEEGSTACIALLRE